MDQNEFYKSEIDNLINELSSQQNSNRQIYERVKEEDFDKKMHEKISSVRDNVKQQIKTKTQYVAGLESGMLSFTGPAPSEEAPSTKNELMLKLVDLDKKIFNILRGTEVLGKMFTVPWRTEQVKVHGVIRSMLLHEPYFLGRNSVMIDFLGLTSLQPTAEKWGDHDKA